MTTCGWTGMRYEVSEVGVSVGFNQDKVFASRTKAMKAIAAMKQIDPSSSWVITPLYPSAPQLYEALADLLSKVEREECHHESTHRGGAIWTFCNDCGKKWADDEGGFVPYVEPTHIVKARAALAAARGEG